MLAISLKWIKKVALMLKTRVFTIRTCEKKMDAIFDSCEELWAKMCSTVCAPPFADENQIFALLNKPCDHSISRRIFENIKTNNSQVRTSALPQKRTIYFKSILFWDTVLGNGMATNVNRIKSFFQKLTLKDHDSLVFIRKQKNQIKKWQLNDFTSLRSIDFQVSEN